MKEIPLEIILDEEDPECAEIYVDAEILDKKYKFILDTGAATTSVVYDSFTRKFNAIKKKTSSGAFTKQTIDDLIKITDIKIGPILKKEVIISRLAQDNKNIRNLLGMDILKDYKISFLFNQSKIIINDDKRNYADQNFYDLILGNKFHPYIDVRIEDTKFTSVWDTGAGITLVNMNMIDQKPNLFELIGNSSGTDSSGTQNSVPTYILKEIEIGNRSFSHIKVAAIDMSYINSQTEKPMDMVLGYTILSRANWLMDFSNKKWAYLDNI